jgi:hypothetical protein
VFAFVGMSKLLQLGTKNTLANDLTRRRWSHPREWPRSQSPSFSKMILMGCSYPRKSTTLK